MLRPYQLAVSAFRGRGRRPHAVRSVGGRSTAEPLARPIDLRVGGPTRLRGDKMWSSERGRAVRTLIIFGQEEAKWDVWNPETWQ